jgi:hypothetical protein
VKTWRWFWSGKCSRVTEQLVRVGAVVAGVALAAAHLFREFHEVTFATIVVALFDASFLFIVMLGWKAPIHFAARVVSAVIASTCVCVLMLGLLGSAVALFGTLVLVLFALTLSSLVVFVPLRASQEIWLLGRRIAYRCPYDDCSFGGLPIHVCPCGERYPNLLPSFYGIFHHTCHHDGDNVDQRLPTLDVLGRSKLRRLCGRCRRPLVHSSLGELSEWPIALVGAPGSGKTVLMVQAVRELRKYYGSFARSSVRVDSDAQNAQLSEEAARMDTGQVPAKTAGRGLSALGLAIRAPEAPGRPRYLLYLYDAPGEDFASVEQFGQKQTLEHLRGVILLVDPFSLPGLRSASSAAAETSFLQTARVLVQGMHVTRTPRPDGKFDLPVAVVIGKADVLPAERPMLAALRTAGGRNAAQLNGPCRDALRSLGAEPAVRTLEQAFAHVAYFVCSGLGRAPDLRDTTPFQPRGVLEPFIWLLPGSQRAN